MTIPSVSLDAFPLPFGKGKRKVKQGEKANEIRQPIRDRISAQEGRIRIDQKTASYRYFTRSKKRRWSLVYAKSYAKCLAVISCLSISKRQTLKLFVNSEEGKF